MLLLASYFLGNLILALLAFYVATARPTWSRWVWLVTGLFVLASAGMVYDLITNPALMRVLLRF